MITRNTLRADGLTVGEALDKDAAFLRSVGHARSSPSLRAETLDEIREGYRETLRKAVLDALDEAAKEMTGDENDGPKDRELPKLFAGLAPIIERIVNKSLGI